MKDIQIRALSGSLYAGVLMGAIFLSPIAITAVVLLFSGLALWEFQRLIQFKSFIPILTLVLLSVYATLGFVSTFTEDILVYSALTINMVLVAMLFISRKIKYSYPVQFVLSMGYIVLSSYFITRTAFDGLAYEPWILALLYIAIWANNSFAYLFGSKFGKHKLLPAISPKKSWEGFFGGMLATILVTYFIELKMHIFDSNLWILFAVLIPVLATLGDFVQSYFKRVAKVKDSGSLIPGHGGFYDRMDSVIFVAPFYYLLLKFI